MINKSAQYNQFHQLSLSSLPHQLALQISCTTDNLCRSDNLTFNGISSFYSGSLMQQFKQKSKLHLQYPQFIWLIITEGTSQISQYRFLLHFLFDFILWPNGHLALVQGKYRQSMQYITLFSFELHCRQSDLQRVDDLHSEQDSLAENQLKPQRTSNASPDKNVRRCPFQHLYYFFRVSLRLCSGEMNRQSQKWL